MLDSAEKALNRNQRLTLALQQHQTGNLAAAEQTYRNLLTVTPHDASVLHLLGIVLFDRGQHESGIACIHRAIAADPTAAHFHSNLASILGKIGRTAEGVEHLRQAIRLDPNFPEAHNNLGVALESLGHLDEAQASFRAAFQLRPDYAEAHSHLGNVLKQTGPISQAVAAHRKAIALKPDYPEAYGNMAATLAEMGRIDEAIAYCETIVALRPHSPRAHSELLFTLLNHPDYSPEAIYQHHRLWAERHAKRYYGNHVHSNSKSPNRRLRVGYVSAHLHAHPVTRFLEPIFKNHNHDAFEIVCYSDVTKPDVVTQRLRSLVDVWRHAHGQSDEQLAKLIQADSIDILVDLDGHMYPHRLLVFARKPAPIQITYLGYPNTTGLKTMDYRITDENHDPSGMTDVYHSEQLLRLDPCCWCYQPDDKGPEVAEVPALRSGTITFGSLNRFVKVTDRMMMLWAKILRQVPNSTLLILVPHGSADDGPMLRQLERGGLPMERVTPIARTTRLSYLEQFNSIDIALDTFPYNGHTTTCDALWMGVPTVSLAGKTHVARAGISVLSNVGLRELVAESPEQYVNIAVDLAKDLSRLEQLRKELRHRMLRSPLLDAKGFTARLENSFRVIWKRWCEGEQAGASV